MTSNKNIEDKSSKQKLHAYGAEIYADWDVYGGKHPRMYKADDVDVEIARLREELRQARIDLAQMAAEALRTIGKVATPSETTERLPNLVDRLKRINAINDDPARYNSEIDKLIAVWNRHAVEPEARCPDCGLLLDPPGHEINCPRRAEKASEPQPDPIPQRYWENK